MFEDVNESGFAFDRPDYKDLRKHLEQNPQPVILDPINRLGRDVLETIYIATHIYLTYEVPIITHRHGEYNLDSINEQTMLIVEAITAGKSVESRIQAAWETIKTRFKEERIWTAWFENVRLGYEIPEDETWPEVTSSGPAVVNAI